MQDTCQYLLTSSEAELDFYLQRQGSQQHKVTVSCGYHGPAEFVTCRILEMFQLLFHKRKVIALCRPYCLARISISNMDP